MALDVEDTPVTNAGLRHLYPLKNLQQLNLRGTKVTGAGVVQLSNVLHNCRVDFGG